MIPVLLAAQVSGENCFLVLRRLPLHDFLIWQRGQVSSLWPGTGDVAPLIGCLPCVLETLDSLCRTT